MITFNEPIQNEYDNVFSNFNYSAIEINGVDYPTVEHAYQAQKTLDKDERIRIASLKAPVLAKKAGRNVEIRDDWEEVKYDVMVECLREKFKIKKFKEALLDTGEEEIAEDAREWNDCVWGLGRSGKGQNLLGKALMQVREEIYDKMSEVDRLFESLENGINLVLVNNSPDKTVKDKQITPEIVRDAFAKSKATHVYLNAKNYADLRAWYRDCLDLETQAVLLKKGLFARMDGVYIIVSKKIKVGELRFLNYDTGKKYQVNLMQTDKARMKGYLQIAEKEVNK